MACKSENGILLYNELSQDIGPEYALKVFHLLSGQQVYFPKAVLQEFRNRSLLQDYRSGVSYASLARKYGLTQKHVRHLTAPAHQAQTPKSPKPKQAPCSVAEPRPGELF